MIEGTKKYMAIGVMAICMLIAGTTFYRTMFSGGSAGSIENRDVSLLCANCGGFEIPADEFRDRMSNNPTPLLPMMPGPTVAMECPKCRKKTCYMAHKCPKCKNIFIIGQAKDINCPDRCPKCSFSETEEQRNSR